MVVPCLLLNLLVTKPIAIHDGGHCLHELGARLFRCEVSVAQMFLLGVGGFD